MLATVVSVLGDVVAAPPNTLDGIGGALLDALVAGKWSLVVALVVMLLVWVAQKTPLVEKLVANRNVRVYVAMGVSTVASVIANFFATDGNWVQAIVQGITTGLASAGLWSAVGKWVAAKVDGSSAAE